MNQENFEKLLQNSLKNFGENYIDIPEDYPTHEFSENIAEKILKQNSKKKFSKTWLLKISAAAAFIIIAVPILILFSSPTSFHTNHSATQEITHDSQNNSMNQTISESSENMNGTDSLFDFDSPQSNEQDNFTNQQKAITKDNTAPAAEGTAPTNQIPANNMTTFISGDISIKKQMAKEDISNLEKLLQNHSFYFDDFTEKYFNQNISFMLNGVLYEPALDGSGVLYLPDSDRYISFSQSETEKLNKILEKYGFIFPCV